MSEWDLDPLAEYQHCCGDIKFNCTCNEDYENNHREPSYWELYDEMKRLAYTRHDRIEGNVISITLHLRKRRHNSLRSQFEDSWVWDVVYASEDVLIVEAIVDDPRLEEAGFIKRVS